MRELLRECACEKKERDNQDEILILRKLTLHEAGKLEKKERKTERERERRSKQEDSSVSTQ